MFYYLSYLLILIHSLPSHLSTNCCVNVAAHSESIFWTSCLLPHSVISMKILKVGRALTMPALTLSSLTRIYCTWIMRNLLFFTKMFTYNFYKRILSLSLSHSPSLFLLLYLGGFYCVLQNVIYIDFTRKNKNDSHPKKYKIWTFYTFIL